MVEGLSFEAVRNEGAYDWYVNWKIRHRERFAEI